MKNNIPEAWQRPVTAAYGGSYQHTASGNLSWKSDVGTYIYGASVAGCRAGTAPTKPHAVAQAGSHTFLYDCNGNTTRRTIAGTGTYYLAYDIENRLTAVSGAASASFVYDGDGRRVKATLGGATTVYAGNLYEYNQSTGEARWYYYFGGQRVALRSSTQGIIYLAGDHLGSTSATYRVNTAQVSTQRYYAWGKMQLDPNTLPTDYTFTGQRADAGIGGLMFFKARWYDPATGRFAQADIIVPGAGNPQSLNRYSYGLSNPLYYTDPTGHCVEPGTPCLVEGGDSPATDDLLQWMLQLLSFRDNGKLNDLQLMYLFLDKAFQLFKNPTDAMKAATNVARPGGLPQIMSESPYVYYRHTASVLGNDTRLGATGFGDLADQGDQVSHFIGEGHASMYAQDALVSAHLPWAAEVVGGAVPFVVEAGRPSQDARMATIDADLGSIGHNMATAINKGADSRAALTTALHEIQSYDYQVQHPTGPAYWSRALEWLGPAKHQLGIAQ